MKILLRLCLLFTLFAYGCSTAVHSTPPEKKPSPSSGQSSKPPATSKPYTVLGKSYTPLASAKGFSQKGIASWYGKKFHGRKTANGEIYNMYAMTAAHKTLPLGTWVRVYNLKNNRQIDVRLNDRGPFVRGRIIDLTYTGAKKLGMAEDGTAPVKIVALGKATQYSPKTSKPMKYRHVDYYSGNFTVQVGAFEIRENAVKYRNRLALKYNNAHFEKYSDDRGTFFRVRIGKFSNLDDAEKFAERFTQTMGGDAFPVAE